MEEDGRSRVTANYIQIKTSVRAVDIVDLLHEDGMLSLDDMERVQQPHHTTNDQMGILIALLLRKRGSFKPFCCALTKTGSDWLVDIMMSTDLSNTPKEPPHELDELDTNVTVGFLVQQIKHQAEFIEMLKSQNTQSQDVPIDEMPNLKQAMKDHNLSEEELVKYVTYLAGKHPSSDSDATDSSNMTGRRRSNSVLDANVRESITITTAIDIISYLSCGEFKKVEPPKNKYEATMRRTVKELITRNKDLFEQYINKIKDNEVTGIQFLFNVADEIFRDNQYNWGRIAALYAFCGWLAKHDVGVGSAQPHQAIGEFLGYYVSEKLGPWIDSNGGWVSRHDAFEDT